MKCWESTFNAQGSRLIIVALQVGAVKFYAARVEALNFVFLTCRWRERKDRVELSSPKKKHKNWDPPTLECWFFNFFESHPIYDETQGSSVVFLTL